MKLKKFLPSFVALLTLSIIITSCLNDENLIPPNCFDGVLNNGELLVDCGGPDCDPCPPSCTNGLWDPDFGEIETDCGGPNCDPCPTCNDGMLNQDELGIDCGGEECDPCSTVGSCINGILDGLETGIDCGGPDCPPCAEPTCDDGIQNGDEEGIDCGGANCPSCNVPDCEDGAQNGLETGIDCGDPLMNCPPCQTASQGQIIFRPNGGSFEVYSGTATVLSMGTDPLITYSITIEGAQGSNEELAFIIPSAEPFAPGGTQTTYDQGSFLGGFVFGHEYGPFGVFSSDVPSSNINVQFEEIGFTAGSTIKGTFSGTISNAFETFSINYTEGSFNLVLQPG